MVIGRVNANNRHWYKAGEVLARAVRGWLTRLVTRCERLVRASQRTPDDIKLIVQFAQA